ncbi:MAG: ABC transporter permease [Candidatus Cloacimonadota bacterium]
MQSLANMNNPSIKFMARKYLKGRGKGLIGKTHYLTLAGIALGVMALICVSSVMNGFQADMENRLIALNLKCGSIARIRKSSQTSLPSCTNWKQKAFNPAP